MKIIITERQEDLLMEGLPLAFRRRYNYDEIKNHLDFSILESLNPCDFDTPSDFVGEMCDMMVEDFIDDYNQETGNDVSMEVKDDLYHFMVHNFAYYLRNFYDKQCQ
jgi:hypothetical protein